jgi:hypothetical protein
MAFEMLPLFTAMLRNIRSKSMNRRFANHSISMNFPPSGAKIYSATLKPPGTGQSDMKVKNP